MLYNIIKMLLLGDLNSNTLSSCLPECCLLQSFALSFGLQDMFTRHGIKSRFLDTKAQEVYTRPGIHFEVDRQIHQTL